MRGFGNHLEHLLERSREIAHSPQTRLELSELGRGRKAAIEQQMGDLFEGRVSGEVFDAVAAIGQAMAFLADRRDGGFAGRDAAQAAGGNWFCFAHGKGELMVKRYC